MTSTPAPSGELGHFPGPTLRLKTTNRPRNSRLFWNRLLTASPINATARLALAQLEPADRRADPLRSQPGAQS